MKILDVTDIDDIHRELLKESGGLPGKSIDRPIESVLYRVFNRILYEKVTGLHEIAALYAYTIASGHPYNDGNKRTAMTSMLVFLQLNGLNFRAPDFDLVSKMIAIAENKINIADFTSWVKSHIY